MNNMNVIQMINQIRQNPSQALSGLGIPQDMMNDPKAMVQHLMNNGKVSQMQYNQVMQMAQGMGIKL